MIDQEDQYFPSIPFRAIVEQSLAGIYVLQDEHFAYANATWAEMIGRTPEEMIGGHLREFVDPGFLDELMALYWRRINGDLKSLRFVTRLVHKDGRVILIEVHGTRMDYKGRPAIVGIGVDVTERLKRDEELIRSKAQMQELAANINRLREEQRAKFARDLHDVLGGMLTSIKMDVSRIMRRVDSPEVQEITHGLLALTQDTINTVREISEELRPSALDHIGLVAAIEKEIAVFSNRYNIATCMAPCEVTTKLSPKRNIAIYRIFQEALTNIARHADATSVFICLEFNDDDFRMEIVDNGRGIDMESQTMTPIGLLGMSERAREIGGTLEIGHNPGGGTRLCLFAPLVHQGVQ